jgi:hypothetical protein
MSWKLEHRAGDTHKSPDGELHVYPETRYRKPGYYAGPGYMCSNTHTVETRKHYSGSGPLNGEKEWPHVILHVNFPTGREDLAEELSLELRNFLDQFLKNHDLNLELEEA